MRILSALLLGVWFASAASACMSSKAELDKQFSHYDTNQDGALSEAEFVAGETKDVDADIQHYDFLPKDYRESSFAWAHKRYAEAKKNSKGLMTRESFTPRARQKLGCS